MSGKTKKNKEGNVSDDEQKRREELETLRQERQKEEEERQRKWVQAWDKKLQEQERLEDCMACCAPNEYFRRPRTQSNIWIQVNHEKNHQQVQMAFKSEPVPKPKPPPLPKLKIINAPTEEEGKSDSKPIIDGKNGSKKKKK